MAIATAAADAPIVTQRMAKRCNKSEDKWSTSAPEGVDVGTADGLPATRLASCTCLNGAGPAALGIRPTT